MPKTAETDSPEKTEGQYTYWMAQIQDALAREKTYRTLGQQSVDLYEAKAPDETPFAILYSNIEILAPAVYNSKPIPIVQRRYKDSDPVGKAVADVGTRALKYLSDVDSISYDPYDELIQAAVLDGLITNRGLTRFKFTASTSRLPECVHGEAVRWDKFFHGYARTWKKVPWVGFEWDMTEAEVRENFPGIACDFTNIESLDDDSKEPEPKDQLKGVKLCKVYEVWDKASKTVMFFCACYTKGPLRKVEDPLGLTGFFPIPRPLNFMRKVTTLVPTPLYQHYKQQAQELNEITRRLKAIVRAIKYRGAYNGAVEGIDNILKAEDNEMVPIENIQSMPDGTTMDKLIWTVPVQELAETARNLYLQREQIKTVIHEITGISDILRGASVASETATAQNIKNQWGSLRLKKMQKEVQRYCRETYGLMLEIAANKFEQETLQKMTSAPYMTQAEKQQVQSQIQQAQMMAQTAAQQPQLPGQSPAQPSQMPEIPPAVQAMLAKPSWEEIYALMQDEISSNYKTEIETNSTIDAEAAQDKQDISELLNALSQFLNGLAPLVQDGLMPFDIAKEMLLVIARRYNFGAQLEDSLLSMEAPQPKGEDSGEQAKAAAMQAEMQLKMQMARQTAELSAQEHQQKMAMLQLQAQIDQMEMQIKMQEMQLQEMQLQEKAVAMKLQQQSAAHQQKMEQIAAQAATAKQKEKEPARASV